MIIKKLAAVLATVSTLAVMTAVPAFAATPVAKVPFCTISDCTQTVKHLHDGHTYLAHTLDDGHTYHVSCGVSGCSQLGTHTTHDGHHSSNGGHHGNHRSSGRHH